MGFRNFQTVNPLCIIACEKTTDEALKASIDSLWPDDPVHPTDKATLSC
jgi:hypothetical protein